MTHAHDHHHVDESTDRRSLLIALGLISAFMVAEVTAAVLAHSLALLADAGHMLIDAGALAGALWAIRLAAQPVSARWSYGFKRAEILAASVNGVTLVVVGGIVLVAAVQRLLHPIRVAGPTILAVALAGVVVNVSATWVLAGARSSGLNVEGAFQHIVTDAAGFIATAVAAAVIITTGYRRADAIASLVVVGLMGRAAWGLLRASGHILLEGTPEGVDLDAVRRHLLAADDHVLEVHDLHAWVLTSSLPAISAHVVVDDSCFADGHAPQILDALQAALIGEFDVEHSTIQLEMAGHSEHELGAH
ncbi:MAG TPA: cation diffusion facilitator family transporter [Acidimicrobiales bacterium]|nr:cation diffusion facilitator family transporter [Acidimicrobiales bacterium]